MLAFLFATLARVFRIGASAIPILGVADPLAMLTAVKFTQTPCVCRIGAVAFRPLSPNDAVAMLPAVRMLSGDPANRP